MTLDNQKTDSAHNGAIIIVTIILGIIGLSFLSSMYNILITPHAGFMQRLGTLIIAIIAFLGLLSSITVLIISKYLDTKYGKLTIIPIVIFSLSLVIFFFFM